MEIPIQNLTIEISLFLDGSNFAASTIKGYKCRLSEFARVLAKDTNTPLEELHLQKIYELYDNNNFFIAYRPIDISLIDNYLISRINRGYYFLRDNRDALGSFFNYLNRNYDFPNLMKELNFNVSYYRPKNIKVDILSRHDLLKFFHYIVFNSHNRDRDVLLFILFITTGCRSSEIVNIKVQDISWEENILYLPKTKHNKSKYIPFRPGLGDSVKVYCMKYNLHNQDSLFDLDQTQMRNLFYKCLDQANLPRVRLHSLRHSFATMMVEAGAMITEVKQLLGHVDIFTTKGYVHPNLISNKKVIIKENKEIFDSISKLLRQLKL